MNANVQSIVKVLKAGQVLPVACTGTYLLLYSSTGPFTFSVDGGADQTGLCILGINFAQDPTNRTSRPFTNILLTNTSTSANTITFFVSSAPITYIQALATTFTKEAPTFPKCSGVQNPIDGATVVYSGVGPAGQQRKRFIVTNTGGINLWFNDGAANGVLLLPNNIPYTFETSGSVTINNPAGSGAGQFYVTEIFYV